jgi:xanthine dehydrogenase small subunit
MTGILCADVIRTVFDDRIEEIRDIDPTMTVLDYLRTVKRRCGTKEGCAEGDCGACTVVLGELADGEMRYRAINSCIQFVPTLDGKQLITVEDLADADGSLHPVQQAMVDHHASQCGFCTPGFVMSLFALYKGVHGGEPAPERDLINDALAGNLCRCTGYRPIVDAALAVPGYAREPDRFARREAETAALLAGLRRDRMLAYQGQGRRFFAPVTVGELADVLADHPEAVILAGGTDVGLWVTKQHRRFDTVIYTGNVAELHLVGPVGACLEIGAAATYTEAFQRIDDHFPDFAAMLRRLGSVQIRNAGTFGGNIANGSPIGDSMPALIALGAVLVLRRRDRQRRMPLEDFFLGYRKTALEPGEFVEKVEIPLAARDGQFHVYKIAKRFDQDISAVLGAFRVRIADGVVREVRIAFGGMAAIPKRAVNCEAALIGRPWGAAAVAEAADALDRDFAPLSDMRASADYRRMVARNLLEKFRIETTEPETAVNLLAEVE